MEYFSHTLQLGPVAELAGVPQRGTVVLRAGGLVRITLSGDLEARGTFIPPIVTRDPLGTRGGDAFLVEQQLRREVSQLRRELGDATGNVDDRMTAI